MLTGIGDEAAPSLPGQLAVVRELGWQTVELRTVDGQAVADLDRAGQARLVREVRAAGVRVVCFDARIGSWAGTIADPVERDVAELTTLARLCAELGTRYVRIMSYPNANLPGAAWRHAVVDRIRLLTDLAAQAGIVLLHENCAGWAATSAKRALDLLNSVDSPALRLLFDVGNGVAHGYDAPAMLAELVAFVAHVHVKDAVGGGEDTTYTLPGDGRAGVAECLHLLRENGYTGALSLEPHLATRPHEDRWAADGAAGFIAAAHRLAELSC